MAVYFLGAFPPTYGGVTIKNESLYQALSKYIDLKKVDFNLSAVCGISVHSRRHTFRSSPAA